MIFVALGSNLPHPNYGDSPEVLQAALNTMPAFGIEPVKVSPFYRSAPWPANGDPDYVNAVAQVRVTEASPEELLLRLHAVEAKFGRIRTARNAARVLDLDLLAYHQERRSGAFTLPHPRLSERAFVLKPLQDIAPDWRHPVSGERLAVLLSRIDERQRVTRIAAT